MSLWKDLRKNMKVPKNSVADPGCLSLIPNPNFSILVPGFMVKKIPDSESHKIFLTPKIVSKLSEI